MTTPASTIPDWYPSWAKELADLYFSGTTCFFVLHGNVHDLLWCPGERGDRYCNLAEFLATQLFGKWDVVLHHDLARGLRPLAGNDPQRLQGMVQYLASRMGSIDAWPRDPDTLLLALDRFLERNLVEEDEKKRKSIGLIFAYAQFLASAGDLGSLGRAQATNLVRFLSWAQNPYLKRLNTAFCLITDKLSDLNDRLVQSQHVSDVEIPFPDLEERTRFCQWLRKENNLGPGGMSVEQLAELSNGLTLNSLQTLLLYGKQSGKPVETSGFKKLKKTLIERQCQNLLEFVEPKHTLDMVVGLQAAKDRLREDAELLTRGRLEAAPMGYLICGPVGTGKSFLAECYAGSIGIPCVKLRNFRSKYVGETEGNLEQVLTVLRSLGPVVVLIDEADATLGTRQAEGDSGTSSRVFAMIASQMGDTRYRGQIIWMLLTSRPDLLPIDLKRQGRAEVHVPLFYPQDDAEFREMFRVMAKKNRVKLEADAIPAVPLDRHLSGSDVESIVLQARRRLLAAGREEMTRGDLEQALAEFIPSAQGLEKEMQEIAAVLECTQMNFLPERWRIRVIQPEGRSTLQERLVAIRQILEDR